MLDGYGGRSSISRRIGDEATGYYLGGNSANVPERYRQLVDCIRELRKVDETFDRMVDSVVRKSIHLI